MRRFEDEMVAHLSVFAPKHCSVIGEKNVREVVRLGITSAANRGFTQRGPVQFFLELMFMFGSYFDTDTQHPWATESLNCLFIAQQIDRADALHLAMMDYLEKISGPANLYAIAALRETRKLVTQAVPDSIASITDWLQVMIDKIYPQKNKWLGRERVQTVISDGIQVAIQRGVTSMRGLALFGILGFSLGHGFSDDPLYPWISHTLQNPLVPDPDVRAGQLERKAILYLDRALQYLSQ